MTGQFEAATAVLDEAIENGDIAPVAAARASLVLLLVRLRAGDAEGWAGRTFEQEIASAIEVFEQAADDSGLAMAWRLRGWEAGAACRFGDCAEFPYSEIMRAVVHYEPRKRRP